MKTQNAPIKTFNNITDYFFEHLFKTSLTNVMLAKGCRYCMFLWMRPFNYNSPFVLIM